MMKGKNGQAAIVGLMIGVMVFMCAMIFIAPIADVIDEARGASQLDCAAVDPAVDPGKASTCLIVDLILPYFIAVVLAVGAGYISARFV